MEIMQRFKQDERHMESLTRRYKHGMCFRIRRFADSQLEWEFIDSYVAKICEESCRMEDMLRVKQDGKKKTHGESGRIDETLRPWQYGKAQENKVGEAGESDRIRQDE
jgi:hypothetical protein